MISVLHQVALGCKDLERAVEFYTRLLGADCIAKFDPPGLAFFDLGPTRLLLERSDSVHSGSSVLYFSVEAIRNEYELLQSRGIVFTMEPHLIHRDEQGHFGASGNEEWMAFFEDPDGNALALVERRMRDTANLETGA